MGCSPQVQQETQTTTIESDRKHLSSQYPFNRLNQPFQLKVRFSQGISIRGMKKPSVIIQKPCQSIEEDPIFQEEIHIDSALMNESINQSHSSKGILKSQKNIIVTQKKVTFDQSQLSKYYLEATQKKKVQNKKKIRKSIYVF